MCFLARGVSPRANGASGRETEGESTGERGSPERRALSIVPSVTAETGRDKGTAPLRRIACRLAPRLRPPQAEPMTQVAPEWEELPGGGWGRVRGHREAAVER